ncbi:HU family DNA-binding protein [Candidatus Uhrbacteria bacterium]|nr:HU family DNA-binding protein [Candidatus Uhrbacteria bacterium]
MNKAELIQIISEKIGVTKKQGEDIIELLVETITTTLQAGGEVTIAGFGTFMSKTRKGRVGVNPQRPTEKIQIPPVTVPKFKAGLGLKKALKERDKVPVPAPAII